ncbi:hypothetical protein XI03_07585 [Bradyrhizobium sp. CCBAU 65884]|uniref:hypothetical protein n=1 Tax=Bradyrhizobium sp. CCBAU 65884 TaxID=722477 RepID=UPI002306341C|nr:hypothetical protein [Bradyrhizobium sp. CCBAU 65884]MDA9474374.1 hypothetical protein [Bradyrhizobium sp. CCBAU 65884]
MYNPINGSSYLESSPFAETSEQTDEDSFADAFANMRLAASRPYSLVSSPPVVEIKKNEFREAAKDYYGPEIKYIAKNPKEYSDFVSGKAERTAELAEQYGNTKDSANARYFSYQLTKVSDFYEWKAATA